MFGSKKEIFEFIELQRDHYKLKLLCEVYDVSRLGYAAWKSRGMSKHDKRDIELRDCIERLFGEVNGIYGSPITDFSNKMELVLERIVLQGLCKKTALKAGCTRVYKKTTHMDRFYAALAMR